MWGGVQEGLPATQGVPKGSAALSLLDLLSPESSQPVPGCTHRWDECAWREKARMDTGFLARGLTYPDNELNTPLTGSSRDPTPARGAPSEPVLC